jgi:hypothetical protein
MCDGIAYNPTNQRCVSNVVQTRCGTGNNDYYNPATQFCNANVIYEKCNGTEYNPTNQICVSNIVQIRCGTGDDYYNPEIQFCYENRIYRKCNGGDYVPRIEYCYGNIVNEYGFVEYAGQTYKTVEIGAGDAKGTWMAENSNYDSGNSSICPSNDQDPLCLIYGRRYSYPGTGSGLVCPNDWKVPTKSQLGSISSLMREMYGFADDCWWSRTTYATDAAFIYTMRLSGGTTSWDAGNRSQIFCRVRCVK